MSLTCSACGHSNTDGARFCSGCGGKIEQPSAKCQSCGHTNTPGARFCSGCGGKLDAQQPAKCPACGHTNNASAAFCGGCGSKRGAAAAPSAAFAGPGTQQPDAVPQDYMSMIPKEYMSMIPPEQMAIMKNQAAMQPPAPQPGPSKYECQSCGYMNKTKVTFCGECGGKMGQSPPPQPTVGAGPGAQQPSAIPPEYAAMFPPEYLASLPPEYAAMLKGQGAPQPAAAARPAGPQGMKVPYSGVSISAGSKYEGGETIHAIVIGLTQQMKKEGAVAILVPTGAPHSEHTQKQYPEDVQTGGYTQVKFIAPWQGGDHEVRMFSSGRMDDTTLIASAAFSVTADVETAVTVSVEKSQHAGYQMITVKGVSGRMAQGGAFVGLYTAGADPSQHILRKRLEKGDNWVPMEDVSGKMGEYEVRVYNEERKCDDSTLAAVEKIRVKGLICPACSLENQIDLKVCKGCGAKLQPRKCYTCGYDENPPEAKYCDICGAKRD